MAVVICAMGTKWCTTVLHSCNIFQLWSQIQRCLSGNRLLKKTSIFLSLSESFLNMIWWLMSASPQPPLPQRLREDLLVFRVMLLKGYIGAGCLPRQNPDAHTKTVVPLYGLCEGREPKQLCPFLQWKRPANVKSKRSPCWKACDLFMAFRFTLSDAGSCEAEH